MQRTLISLTPSWTDIRPGTRSTFPWVPALETAPDLSLMAKNARRFHGP